MPEVTSSPALSLLARPGDGSIRMRRIAILVADGIDGTVASLYAGLAAEQAVPRFVGARLGTIQTTDGAQIEADVTMEAMPSVLFDALVVPDGSQGVMELSQVGHAIDFVKEQYRHCKPILVLGAGRNLVDAAGVKWTLPSGDQDSGLLYFEGDDMNNALAHFIKAIAAHRHFEREMDPPLV